MLARRSFIIGLSLAFAAPAIVRAASIMPVKVMPSARELEFVFRARHGTLDVLGDFPPFN